MRNFALFLLLAGTVATVSHARRPNRPRSQERVLQVLIMRLKLTVQALEECRAQLPQTTTGYDDDWSSMGLLKRDAEDSPITEQIRLLREELQEKREDLEECLEQLGYEDDFEDDDDDEEEDED